MAPLPPSPMPMAGPQAPHQLNPALRQNMAFSTETKNFLGTAPSTDPSLSGEDPLPTPNPLGACRTSNPPILKSRVRHWACAVAAIELL